MSYPFLGFADPFLGVIISGFGGGGGGGGGGTQPFFLPPGFGAGFSCVCLDEDVWLESSLLSPIFHLRLQETNTAMSTTPPRNNSALSALSPAVSML